MKILLTGATGYIGKRLLPILIENGHKIVCCVRDFERFNPPLSLLPHLEVIQVDLLDANSLKQIPKDIDAAYYLVHSMSSSNNYEVLEKQSAINFRDAINNTNAVQVIYLSGIINQSLLSKHLKSRENVELELQKGKYKLTTLRAGIIIGSGSASFEIIRDLVEKLPVMITPKWLKTQCQPIAIRDVISILSKSLLNPQTYNQNYDIGGPDILSYKKMLLDYAKLRKLNRKILILPIMTPRLSSYWLYFVTTTTYRLAIALVNSMKIEVICRDNKLISILNIQPLTYEEALSNAFLKIESNEVVSSWKDSLSSGRLNIKISDFINVPRFGCLTDERSQSYIDREACIDKIWRIGGKNGWYYANFLWKFRGYLDLLVGGVGLRRGRTDEKELKAGDSLDFWRVLYANKEEGRLLLFAEMKLPGEAWLEFKLDNGKLIQTATYRPIGVTGRLYWYTVYPFHGLIFKGMLSKLVSQ
ncbi:SDR family oxidoreductase [Ancylomarina sp. DW003]|nr:SDR family oxidoreductase [Ancylomarina sp. DW003]MDE5422144.1 SDR family oxidoreductase [Ancylomarina sp. DW003]